MSGLMLVGDRGPELFLPARDIVVGPRYCSSVPQWSAFTYSVWLARGWRYPR